MNAEPDTPTLAHYVLRAVDEPGPWIQPGSFYELLIDAVLRADVDNLRRLGLGFPRTVEVVTLWRALGAGPLLKLAASM